MTEAELVGQGYIRKNKDAFKGGRDEDGPFDWKNPIYKAPIKINNQSHIVECYQATGKWGRTDLYMKVYKKYSNTTDENYGL